MTLAPMIRRYVPSVTTPSVGTLIGVVVSVFLMTQQMWTSPGPPTVCLDFWTSVYQAIDD